MIMAGGGDPFYVKFLVIIVVRLRIANGDLSVGQSVCTSVCSTRESKCILHRTIERFY